MIAVEAMFAVQAGAFVFFPVAHLWPALAGRIVHI